MEIKKGQIYKRNDGEDDFSKLYFEVTKVGDGGDYNDYDDDYVYGVCRNKNWDLLRNDFLVAGKLLKNYTLDTSRYRVGDILDDGDGKERMVLGVLGNVYYMSSWDDFNQADDGFTKEELDDNNYTLKQPECNKDECSCCKHCNKCK